MGAFWEVEVNSNELLIGVLRILTPPPPIMQGTSPPKQSGFAFGFLLVCVCVCVCLFPFGFLGCGFLWASL